MNMKKSRRSLSLLSCCLFLSCVLLISSTATVRAGISPWAWQLRMIAATGQLGGANKQVDISDERQQAHLPDPEDFRTATQKTLLQAHDKGKSRETIYLQRTLALIDSIRRDKQLRLSLEDVIHRTLKNNYAIEVQRFNPAIETTKVVEAESAFDAVFFTNVTKNNVDRPSGSQLTATDLDFFNMNTGVRKLLPAGTQVSARYELNRTKTTLTFQEINPEYTTNLIFEMRQPFLRGFGMDYNRSLILITQNDRRISDWVFQRQVRDTLRNVEEMYWRLLQARRDLVISARVLADFEQILEYLDARKDFDVIPVQLNATQANLEQSRAEFIRRVSNVFDAEDRLISGMNSHDINLADNVELITTDFPQLNRIVIDRLAEVKAAIENRRELKEQQSRVTNAKLNAGRAKNNEMPRLDMTFRSTTAGLAKNADQALDQASTSNFIEYAIGMEFEVPIGNRGPIAAYQRAKLLHLQQVALMKKTLEDIILDVNLAVRKFNTAYDQISPSYESAQAREREVESIVARAERKDLNTLNSELSARQSLANSRSAMLNAMVEYNIAIIDLERAKGTLLPYNNVITVGD